MPENDPEPVRRGREALERRAGEFADPACAWELVVQCAGLCRAQRRLVADLVPLVPPELTWAEVPPKLRCSACGAPADNIGLGGPPAAPGVGGSWLLLQRGPGKWRRG
ncbi:hypothetical protein ACFQX4_22855 [Roseomonas sp. GCM10028921]